MFHVTGFTTELCGTKGWATVQSMSMTQDAAQCPRHARTMTQSGVDKEMNYEQHDSPAICHVVCDLQT